MKENGRIEDKNTEQCQNELWTFYYIAAAPLFQMDASPEIPASWREDKTLDYDVKTSAARYIATQDIDRLAAVLSVSREKIAGLYALYAAKILHDIKQIMIRIWEKNRNGSSRKRKKRKGCFTVTGKSTSTRLISDPF